MSPEYVIGVIVALGLCVYLVYALVWAERF